MKLRQSLALFPILKYLGVWVTLLEQQGSEETVNGSPDRMQPLSIYIDTYLSTVYEIGYIPQRDVSYDL